MFLLTSFRDVLLCCVSDLLTSLLDIPKQKIITMAKSIIPFLPLFVLLVIVVDFVTPLIPCTTNAECRRNPCIQNFCRPRSATGPCDAANNGDDEDCVGGNVCINAQCSLPSFVGNGCDNGDIGDCFDGLVCTSSTCSIGWIRLGDMPQSRRTGAGGTIGNSIYLAAGFNVLVTSRFQPNATPQWSSFDDFPSGAVYFVASAVVGGKLVVMGGARNSDGSTSDEVWSFDPSQPSGENPSIQWEQLTSMPSGGRLTACAASYQNWIYVFGGFGGSSDPTSIFVFDTATNGGMGLWTTLVGVTLPQVSAYCAAAQAGDYIYVTGGTPDGSTHYNTILRFKPNGSGGGAFDPFPDGSVPVLNIGRNSHTATTINEKIVVTGGLGPEGSTISVEMFDPSSNTVSSLPAMNVGHYNHEASAIGSNLFVFGGLGSGVNEATVERLFLPA